MNTRAIMISPWGGSARTLATELGIRCVPLRLAEKRMDRIARAQVIINWGTRRVLGSSFARVLNFPSRVAVASNKLSCMKALRASGVPTLEFTTNKEEAEEWLKKASVIGHHDLYGHSGSGLELCRKGKSFTRDDIKVYTKYFPKEIESRVHLIRTGTGYHSMYLEKVRITKDKYEERGISDSPTTFIRTWANGWNFARNPKGGVDSDAIALARRAVDALGLDFAAIDIMRKDNGPDHGNENNGRVESGVQHVPSATGEDVRSGNNTGRYTYVVGECNTAPGIEGACLDFYKRGFEPFLHGRTY